MKEHISEISWAAAAVIVISFCFFGFFVKGCTEYQTESEKTRQIEAYFKAQQPPPLPTIPIEIRVSPPITNPVEPNK